MTKDNERITTDINKLPNPKVRLYCMRHGTRLRFIKRFGGYACKDNYCTVVRVVNVT